MMNRFHYPLSPVTEVLRVSIFSKTDDGSARVGFYQLINSNPSYFTIPILSFLIALSVKRSRFAQFFTFWFL